MCMNMRELDYKHDMRCNTNTHHVDRHYMPCMDTCDGIIASDGIWHHLTSSDIPRYSKGPRGDPGATMAAPKKLRGTEDPDLRGPRLQGMQRLSTALVYRGPAAGFRMLHSYWLSLAVPLDLVGHMAPWPSMTIHDSTQIISNLRNFWWLIMLIGWGFQ